MKFWQSLVWLLGVMVPFLSAAEGARVIAFHGFNDCIELTNGKARVILCPAVGGRVLEYSIGCLLYTSPSPRDRTRYRMPSSA